MKFDQISSVCENMTLEEMPMIKCDAGEKSECEHENDLKTNYKGEINSDEYKSSGSDANRNEVSDGGIDIKDNLNKYSECKKIEAASLSNLLKNFQKSPAYSSGSDYDDDGSGVNSSSTLNLDYKSLIEAISGCDINKDNTASVTKDASKIIDSFETKSNNSDSCIISDVQTIFDNKDKSKSKLKDKHIVIANAKNSKADESQGKIHVQENRMKNERSKYKNHKNLDKLESVALMESLSAKISSMNLLRKTENKLAHGNSKKQSQKKTVEKTDSKNDRKNLSEDNETITIENVKTVPKIKKEKKALILLERGPWSKPKKFTVRNSNPFYQGNQQLVNQNFLSGGEFWTADDPIDLIPQTIPEYEQRSPETIDSFANNNKDYCEIPLYNDVNNVHDSLSPSAIAEALEKEVLLFNNGIANESLTHINTDSPNWGELDMIINIMEREARHVESRINFEKESQAPKIIIDEPTESVLSGTVLKTNLQDKTLDSIKLSNTIHNLTNTVNKNQEIPYEYQRVDQQSPQNSSWNNKCFTFKEADRRMNNQTLDIPSMSVDLGSPRSLYSPGTQNPISHISWNSSNSCTPSPSSYSATNTSTEDSNVFNYDNSELQNFSDSSRGSLSFNVDSHDFVPDNCYISQSSRPTPLTVELCLPNHAYNSRNQTTSLNIPMVSNVNNTLNYGNSPDQCYRSPNIERIESTNYDNLYDLSSPLQRSNLRESFSSSSSVESPGIYLCPDEFELVSKALSNHCQQSDARTPESITEENDVLKDFGISPSIIERSIVLEKTINESLSTNQNLVLNANNGSKLFNLNGNSGGPNTWSINQKQDQKLSVKNSKISKTKPVPIAAKQSYPCCAKIKKSAKCILEEMFERLDENMQRNICMKVHNLDNDSLVKLLDWLLSGWSEGSKLQLPRLPLVYTICERMLMTADTMVKFFKTYGNGHTVLDRAILTCPQTPILSRYIAECSIKSLNILPKDRDYVIDKSDAFGNGILHRAVQNGALCASPLAALLQLNTCGTILNVNKLNSDGYSPLHIACSSHLPQTGGVDCCCLMLAHVLLDHGKADPNVKDGKSGKTSLHMAVDSNGCAPALVSLLLRYGADPSMRNYSSATPLDLAKSACRSSSAPQYPKQVVDILKKLKRPY